MGRRSGLGLGSREEGLGTRVGAEPTARKHRALTQQWKVYIIIIIYIFFSMVLHLSHIFRDPEHSVLNLLVVVVAALKSCARAEQTLLWMSECA